MFTVQCSDIYTVTVLLRGPAVKWIEGELDPMNLTRWPESRAPRGMVATPHLLASQSGVAALRAGGTALDAAVAAAATIAVVYPHMNGLGGDNFWLIYDARSRALKALCGAGRAAREASIEWYAARGIAEAIPPRGGA